MPLCLRTISGRTGIWNFFFFSRKGEGRRNINLSEQWRVISNLNACTTSTPGFEPSPHWWEESALTPSFSFWGFFCAFLCLFPLFFFFVSWNRSQCLLILQSPEHLHSYCRIPWFKPLANCKNRVKFSQLCCVKKGLNRRGEVWPHVAMAAKSLDHKNGELKQRQRKRQKSNRFITQNNNFVRALRFFVQFLAVVARPRN